MTTPDRHPLRRLFDPRDRFGGYALPPLAIILIVVGVILAFALGFVSGWQSRPVYDAHFFRQHYNVKRQNIPIPPKGAPIPVRPRAIPAAGSINLARYPAVGDQGTLGACAAWATAWDVSYEWRMLHPTSFLRFSPRQMYDHYSDVYNGGQDGGSWPDADVEISGTTGLLQFKMLPEPPYVIDDPIPTYDTYGHLTATDAAKHRFATSVHQLGPMTTGGGQGVVDNIEASIAAGHPVAVAFPVYPEYDNATQTGGLIGMPQIGEGSRGGHENVAIAYDNDKVFPDGWRGGIEVQNQWNTWWGAAGRAWFETRFVAQYVFGPESLTIGRAAGPGHPSSASSQVGAGPFRPADGGNTALHSAPGAPSTPPMPKRPQTTPAPGSASWYVHGVTLTTGQNVSGLLNSWGDHYRVWPVGLAATLGIESGLNPRAERWAGGLDNSCGLSQVIITNVAYYTGIQGARAECDWEEVPANAVYLMSRIYAEYFAYQHNCVTWPYAYGMYNGGAGYSCAYYFSPSGDIAAHVQVFLGWYNFALTHWQGGTPNPPPPPPTPKKRRRFPIKRWCGDLPRTHCPSPYFHKHAGTVAAQWAFNKRAFGKKGTIYHACGRVKTQEQWNPKRRVMFQSFRHCFAWSWPTKRGDPTKWVKVK